MKTPALFLFLFASSAQADITYLQETLPGGVITSNRGYVTTPAGAGFTQVTPTIGGMVDNSRPGYLIGPTLPSSSDLTEPRRRITPKASYDRFD